MRKRCQSASSASFCARPAAFHSVIRSRKRAAVGPQSSESASFSASSASSSLRARAPARCRSRSAKCEPRRRLNASRALENRFHSSSSVLRSMPRTVRHSSRIALKRSPACFHCVASAASVSASAASASLRATAATRAASRSARWAPTACSACITRPSSSAPSPTTSPTTCASARPSRRVRALDSVCLGSAPPDGQPADQQLGLGEHVVEAAGEVGEALGGLAGLPRADRPLAVRGAHVDGAVGVDAAPPLGVRARRCHRVPGRGRRRRDRDRVRRLGRVRRLVRMCRGGTRRHGVELVLAARLDARSGVRRRGPRTRVLGDARPVRRGRCRSARAGASGTAPTTPRRARRRCPARRPAAACSAGGLGRCGVARGRGCRRFTTVLVCGVERCAVRLRCKVGTQVLLRHGRLPPPARRDGGRPAAAGPRSAGRRRSMRTVATSDSNSSGARPEPLQPARRLSGGSTATSRRPRYAPIVISPAGRPAAAGRRRRAHRDGQVRPRRGGRRGPGRRGRQRRRDGPLPGDGRRHGQARPRRARRRPAPPARRPRRHRDRLRRRLPAGGAGGRRGSARPRAAHRCWSAAPGCTCRPWWTSWSSPARTRQLRAELEAELAGRRTGRAAHPAGRGRPRRRGRGAAQQRPADRAGAGGGHADRPPVPGPPRDRRAAALRRGAARRGPPDRRARRAGRPPRRPDVRRRTGRRDPRPARPRPARRAARPRGRSATSRSSPRSTAASPTRGGTSARRPSRRCAPRGGSSAGSARGSAATAASSGSTRGRTCCERALRTAGSHDRHPVQQGPRHRERLRRAARPRRHARPDRRPGRRALRPPPRARRGRGAAGGPVGRAQGRRRSPPSRASSGSWTTATRTAASPEMCGNGVRVYAALARPRAAGCPTADAAALGTRAGDPRGAVHRPTGSPSTWARPASGRRRPPRWRRGRSPGRRWTSATRTWRASPTSRWTRWT